MIDRLMYLVTKGYSEGQDLYLQALVVERGVIEAHKSPKFQRCGRARVIFLCVWHVRPVCGVGWRV